MRGRWNSIFVCAVFVAAASMAQQTNTPVETPGGTVGTIPEFWGSVNHWKFCDNAEPTTDRNRNEEYDVLRSPNR